MSPFSVRKEVGQKRESKLLSTKIAISSDIEFPYRYSCPRELRELLNMASNYSDPPSPNHLPQGTHRDSNISRRCYPFALALPTNILPIFFNGLAREGGKVFFCSFKSCISWLVSLTRGVFFFFFLSFSSLFIGYPTQGAGSACRKGNTSRL